MVDAISGSNSDMSHRDRLIAHLGRYIRQHHPSIEPGVFTHRSKPQPYDHVLPVEEKWLNIPPEYRATVQSYCAAHGIKLHRYFHHLNSSQAVALALFVPFFEGGREFSDALLRALGASGHLASWKAEEIPVKSEATNLDATWTFEDGTKTLCEVKLTEQEFGIAKNDPKHQSKLSDVYAPVLRGHVRDELLEPGAFFRSYQILRNIWHVVRGSGDRLVFLFPRQNTRLQPELDRVLVGVSSESLRAQISVVYLEDVLSGILDDPLCPEVGRAYAAALQAKYILT